MVLENEHLRIEVVEDRIVFQSFGELPFGNESGAEYKGRTCRFKTIDMPEAGSDELGEFRMMEMEIFEPLKVRIRVKVYRSKHMIFEQEFLEDTSFEIKEGDINGFPEFGFPAFRGSGWKEDYHILTYDQHNCFNFPFFGRGSALQTGQKGKNIPLVLIDTNYHTLIISPANYFLVGTVSLDPEEHLLTCGLVNTVQYIPKGTVFRTIATASIGVNNAFESWGSALRQLAGVPGREKYEDAGLTWLSYWTDAGAAYWYNVLEGKSYEETIMAYVGHHRDISLPIGVYQFDSWWYERDGGYLASLNRFYPRKKVLCKNFNADDPDQEEGVEADVFSSGSLDYFQQEIKKPFITHFKHVSVESPYIDENENTTPAVKQFRFIKDTYAIPEGFEETVRFFKYILDPSFGIATFEHDWLSYIYFAVKEMQTLEGGRDFFKGMNRAASETDPGNNIVPRTTLQLCMATPSITLESVELESVTTLRTSADTNHMGYEGAQRWWWNTFSARLVTALGRYPFFDNRHSNQDGGSHQRSNAELEFIWICLSCGMLGIGDAIGEENVARIRKAIDAHGKIVKPESPAVPLDRCYLSNPNADDAVEALTIVGYDEYSFGRVHYVESMNCNNSGQSVKSRFSLDDVGCHVDAITYDFRHGQIGTLAKDDTFEKILEDGAFDYHIVSPLINDSIAIIGNPSKYVPLSRTLFDEIIVCDNCVTIIPVEGSAETCQIALYSREKPSAVRYDDSMLPEKKDAPAGEPGWHWDAHTKLFSMTVQGDVAQVEILFD